MLNLITMIEYVNSFLLLTLLGTIYYIYYKYRIFFRAINIVMDSAILDQLDNQEKEVNSEVVKSKRKCCRKQMKKRKMTLEAREKDYLHVLYLATQNSI